MGIVCVLLNGEHWDSVYMLLIGEHWNSAGATDWKT